MFIQNFVSSKNVLHYSLIYIIYIYVRVFAVNIYLYTQTTAMHVRSPSTSSPVLRWQVAEVTGPLSMHLKGAGPGNFATADGWNATSTISTAPHHHILSVLLTH